MRDFFVAVALSGVVAGCGSSSKGHSPDGGADATPLPACASFDITVSPVASPSPVIWTGAEYLLLTQTQPAVIQVIAADGTLGATFPLGVDLAPWAPMAWTGSELGVLSVSASRDLVLSRFAADGTARGTSTIATGVGANTAQRSLVWAGDRYLAAWLDATGPLAIEEVGADGTPGTPRVIMSGSSDVGGVSFNTIGPIAATSTAFLVEVAFTTGTPTYVTIDRASGATAHYQPRSAATSTGVLAQGADFVFFTTAPDRTGNTDGPGVVTLDAHATLTEVGPVVPALAAPDLVATSSGYRLSGTALDNGTMTYAIQKLDLGPDGAALGSVTQLATAPSNMSASAAATTFRGNGILTTFAYGPNDSWTQRLIQECSP